MTQAQSKNLTFEDYLAYDDGSDSRYDLVIHGALVEVPNESAENDYLALSLTLKLSAWVTLRLIKAHTLTLEVEPVGDDRKSRHPDVAVLRPEHLGFDTYVRRNAVTLDMPPPQLIAEVVSPGGEASDNYRRDYDWKRQQYERLGVPEYWIVDPQRATVTVLVLGEGSYQETIFAQGQVIISPTFPELKLTVDEVLNL